MNIKDIQDTVVNDEVEDKERNAANSQVRPSSLGDSPPSWISLCNHHEKRQILQTTK
jgi:hypothetical protein